MHIFWQAAETGGFLLPSPAGSYNERVEYCLASALGLTQTWKLRIHTKKETVIPAVGIQISRSILWFELRTATAIKHQLSPSDEEVKAFFFPQTSSVGGESFWVSSKAIWAKDRLPVLRVEPVRLLLDSLVCRVTELCCPDHCRVRSVSRVLIWELELMPGVCPAVCWSWRNLDQYIVLQ